MFTHMVHIRNEKYNINNNTYDLDVYEVNETGEYRIFISKSGESIGDIFTASDEIITDAKLATGSNVIEELLSMAKDDVKRNENGLY